MNHTLRILLIVLFLLAVSVGIYLLVRPSGTDVPPPGTDNPFGDTSGGQVGQPTKTLVLTAPNGETFIVPDNRPGHRAVTQVSGTYYYLTESPTGDYLYPSFNIVYGTDSVIAIGLLTEPLGKARTEAEKKLRELFPLPDDALCALRITVMVSPAANPLYAGQNLGLSFCSGSATLPQ